MTTDVLDPECLICEVRRSHSREGGSLDRKEEIRVLSDREDILGKFLDPVIFEEHPTYGVPDEKSKNGKLESDSVEERDCGLHWL